MTLNLRFSSAEIITGLCHHFWYTVMIEPCWVMGGPEHVCANLLILTLIKRGSGWAEPHFTEASEAGRAAFSKA